MSKYNLLLEEQLGLSVPVSIGESMEFKCLVCDSIIKNVTVGSIRTCGCANNLTISNLMGNIVIKALELDYVEEKTKESGDFHNLVY